MHNNSDGNLAALRAYEAQQEAADMSEAALDTFIEDAMDDTLRDVFEDEFLEIVEEVMEEHGGTLCSLFSDKDISLDTAFDNLRAMIMTEARQRAKQILTDAFESHME